MSYEKKTKVERWAWKQHTQSPSQKLMLVTLAWLSDYSGVCKASLNRIAKTACVSRMTAIRHLTALENEALIVSLRNYRKSGRQGVSSYYLQCSPYFTEAYRTKRITSQVPEEAREKALS